MGSGSGTITQGLMAPFALGSLGVTNFVRRRSLLGALAFRAFYGTVRSWEPWRGAAQILHVPAKSVRLSWGLLGSLLEPLLGILEPLLGLLGPLGGLLGASWGLLGPSWGGRLGFSVFRPPFGSSWVRLGGLLGRLGRLLGRLEALL